MFQRVEHVEHTFRLAEYTFQPPEYTFRQPERKTNTSVKIIQSQGESKCLGEKMEKWMRNAIAPEDMYHCLPLHSGPFCNPPTANQSFSANCMTDMYSINKRSYRQIPFLILDTNIMFFAGIGKVEQG